METTDRLVRIVQDHTTACERLRQWLIELGRNDTQAGDLPGLLAQFRFKTQVQATKLREDIKSLHAVIAKQSEHTEDWCSECSAPAHILPDGTHDCMTNAQLRAILSASTDADRKLFAHHAEMQEEIKRLKVDLECAQRDAANFSTQLAHEKNQTATVISEIRRERDHAVAAATELLAAVQRPARNPIPKHVRGAVETLRKFIEDTDE